jgi:HSP20 family molecular chaperone IbpA
MIFQKLFSFRKFILQYPRFKSLLSNSVLQRPHTFKFQNFFNQKFKFQSTQDFRYNSQKFELKEDENFYQIQFEIPSFIKIDNLFLEIKSGYLIIQDEKTQEIKQFPIPEDINIDDTTVSFEDGILQINFKRVQPQNESQTFDEHFMKINKLHFQVLKNLGLTNVELLKKLIRKFNGNISLIIPEYLNIEFQRN